jgi:DNA-binding NarL/FixJ family response regulator
VRSAQGYPLGRRPLGGADQTRPIGVYVATSDGVRAGEILRTLEREGLSATVTWGALVDATSGAARRSDVVVALEPADAGYPDASYRSLHNAMPDASLIVVCSPARPGPQTLLWAGVDGIVVEPGADEVVGAVVRAVLGGYLVLPRALRAAAHPPPLSARERQLLTLVAEGLTNREIAERLFLAESTVKRHLSAAFKRLGVRSRREAAAVMLAAEQRGTGPTPGPIGGAVSPRT